MIKAGWDSLLRAGVYGLTAGVLAGGSNGFAGLMVNGSKEMALKVTASILSGFFFSSYNFIADAIVNKLEVI